MPPSLKSLQSKIATHSTFMNTTRLAGAFHPEIQLLRTEIQEQPDQLVYQRCYRPITFAFYPISSTPLTPSMFIPTCVDLICVFATNPYIPSLNLQIIFCTVIFSSCANLESPINVLRVLVQYRHVDAIVFVPSWEPRVHHGVNCSFPNIAKSLFLLEQTIAVDATSERDFCV